MSSEIKVDTISEKTSAAGVTIDSVLIKDGNVDGIDVSALGTWQDWTPTLTNATQGNGTITARYVQIGKLVVGMFTFTLGSTSAISGDMNITLPVTGATTGFNLASLSFIENGVKDVKGFPVLTTTLCYLRAQKANTTYVENAYLSSSVPFTWGTNDNIILGFSYEAA